MSSNTVHQAEPMGIDGEDSEFDNKENTFQHNNVLPCTEKGYEELDVSELNMKLRYSVTPAVSPMSKSFTNCTDNKRLHSDNIINNSHDESNLTRSLNSTLNKSDNTIHTLKTLPLQSILSDNIIDIKSSVLRPQDTLIITEQQNILTTVSGPSDDDNMSSTTSSAPHTPEAITPTKEISKTDNGSPIMRGLKSVLNMFRSSQSPIPPIEGNSITAQEPLKAAKPVPENVEENVQLKPQALSSTPIPTQKLKESNGSKRSSPYKESIVFNDDLEKELQWKDETTIFFSQEKIPVHKLFFQQTKSMPHNEANQINTGENKKEENLNATVEYMDISYQESVMENKTTNFEEGVINKINNSVCNDSDSEFLDCETTFTKEDLQTKETEKKGLNTVNNFNQLNFITGVEILENYRYGDIQDYLDAEVKPVITNTPAGLNLTHEKSNTVLIDAFDATVQSEKFNADLKTVNHTTSHDISFENKQTIEDQLKNDKSTLELHNMPNTSKLIDEYSEHEPVSIENNMVNKIIDVNVTNTTDDKTINKDSINESNQVHVSNTNISISYKDLTKPAEIPLPDEEDNELEQVQLTKQDIISKSSISDPHHNNIDELTNKTLKFIEDIKVETDNDNLTNIKKMNDTSFTIIKSVNIDEERTIATKITESCVEDDYSVNQSECNNHLNDEIVNNLPLFNLLDQTNINKLTDQNTISDVCNDDISDQTISDEHNKALLSSELQIITEDNNIKKQEGTESVVNQNTHNIDGIECDTKISEISQNSLQTEVECQSNFKNLQQKVKDPIELNIIINTEENIRQQLMQDVIVVSESDKIIDDKKDAKSTHNNSLINNSENNIIDLVKNIDINQEEVKFVSDINEKSLEIILKNENDEKQVIEEVLGISDNCSPDVGNIDMKVDVSPDLVCNPINFTDNMSMEEKEVFVDVLSEKDKTNTNKSQSPNEALLNKQQFCDAIFDNTVVGNETATNLQGTNMNKSIISNTNINTSQNDILTSPKEAKDISNNNVDGFDMAVNLKTLDIKMQEDYETNIVEEIEIHDDLFLDTNTLSKGANICELDIITLDDEIILSENNSPYVSVAADLDKVTKDQTLEACVSNEDKNAIKTACNSPPINSKGYKFNFDEINDPFGTRTNIRMSLDFEYAKQNIQVATNLDNRSSEKTMKVLKTDKRRSIQERKKQFSLRKHHNNTFTGVSGKYPADSSEIYNKYNKSENNNKEEPVKYTNDSENNNLFNNENDKQYAGLNNSEKSSNATFSDVTTMDEKLPTTTLNMSETYNTVNEAASVVSPPYDNHEKSNQLSYFSVDNFSGESIKSRNVFNLPEIDDKNFNSFAVCQSPTFNLDEGGSIESKNIVTASEKNAPIQKHIETDFTKSVIDANIKSVKECKDKMDTEPREKETCTSPITDTCSSNDSQDNTTTKEAKTDDEDTLEGPFLEIEDLTNDKMMWLDVENRKSQFQDIPTPDNETNAEGELFIDAEAYEFLLNQNKSNVVEESGKESLFLKFDPLFAKRMSSDSVFSGLSHVHKRQSTPTKHLTSKNLTNITSAPGPSSLNIHHEKDLNSTNIEEINVSVSKPMMIVSPAVNPVATPRNSLTPTRTNRRSLIFSSPAVAVIDRLISLSANNSIVEHEATLTQVSREQHEADLALIQLRDHLTEKENHVCNLRSENKELKNRLSVLESHMNTLEAANQQSLTNINKLTETLSEKSRNFNSMTAVFEEYERTIASLIAEKEQDKKRHADERAAFINERDELTSHLARLEVFFNDLHSKYEKCKQVILNFKANEESYKKCLSENEENFAKLDNNYELLKQHATSKLNHANEELHKLNKAHQYEVLKLNAMIKRKDLHITSLEETLAQKNKANEELTAICDELINKVG